MIVASHWVERLQSTDTVRTLLGIRGEVRWAHVVKLAVAGFLSRRHPLRDFSLASAGQLIFVHRAWQVLGELGAAGRRELLPCLTEVAPDIIPFVVDWGDNRLARGAGSYAQNHDEQVAENNATWLPLDEYGLETFAPWMDVGTLAKWIRGMEPRSRSYRVQDALSPALVCQLLANSPARVQLGTPTTMNEGAAVLNVACRTSDVPALVLAGWNNFQMRTLGRDEHGELEKLVGCSMPPGDWTVMSSAYGPAENRIID